MAASNFTQVGFIGLGAMGEHMAEQLAAKLLANARIHVFDISKAPIEELEKYPGKVMASGSPRDAAA